MRSQVLNFGIRVPTSGFLPDILNLIKIVGDFDFFRGIGRRVDFVTWHCLRIYKQLENDINFFVLCIQSLFHFIVLCIQSLFYFIPEPGVLVSQVIGLLIFACRGVTIELIRENFLFQQGKTLMAGPTIHSQIHHACCTA